MYEYTRRHENVGSFWKRRGRARIAPKFRCDKEAKEEEDQRIRQLATTMTSEGGGALPPQPNQTQTAASIILCWILHSLLLVHILHRYILLCLYP